MSSPNITSPIDFYSYSPEGSPVGMPRYCEALLLLKEGNKELTYWQSAYERAQQCGLSGLTVQEIILQMDKIGQRMESIKKILLAKAETTLKSDVSSISNPAKEITS